jgi:hypothetical protein
MNQQILTRFKTKISCTIGYSNIIQQNVASICIELSDNEEGFADRGDKQWVSMTLGEAYRGLGLTSDEERLVSKAWHQFFAWKTIRNKMPSLPKRWPGSTRRAQR